jgi:hypothetical protein
MFKKITLLSGLLISLSTLYSSMTRDGIASCLRAHLERRHNAEVIQNYPRLSIVINDTLPELLKVLATQSIISDGEINEMVRVYQRWLTALDEGEIAPHFQVPEFAGSPDELKAVAKTILEKRIKSLRRPKYGFAKEEASSGAEIQSNVHPRS